MLASFLRFCADGSVRGPDNYVVARCLDGLWQVGGRTHREFECEGPVRLRLTARSGEPSVHRGPYGQLRTMNGVLYADDACTNLRMPGQSPDGFASCHEITLLPPA